MFPTDDPQRNAMLPLRLTSTDAFRSSGSAGEVQNREDEGGSLIMEALSLLYVHQCCITLLHTMLHLNGGMAIFQGLVSVCVADTNLTEGVT